MLIFELQVVVRAGHELGSQPECKPTRVRKYTHSQLKHPIPITVSYLYLALLFIIRFIVQKNTRKAQ